SVGPEPLVRNAGSLPQFRRLHIPPVQTARPTSSVDIAHPRRASPAVRSTRASAESSRPPDDGPHRGALPLALAGGFCEGPRELGARSVPCPAVGAMEVPMTSKRVYITTAIPYVNARPHLGFALELVQADALARHRRLRGDEVRLLTGTDDNSLKNVLAAEAAGLTTAQLVARNATHFATLPVPLQLAFDDFIRTSTDPRHQPAVARLWRACAAAGDLYREWYEGLYCVGCEQFYAAEELDRGRCPEHETVPERVA